MFQDASEHSSTRFSRRRGATSGWGENGGGGTLEGAGAVQGRLRVGDGVGVADDGVESCWDKVDGAAVLEDPAFIDDQDFGGTGHI